MLFLRSLGRGVLIVLVTISFGLWIIVATAQLTVLQRQVVMGWAVNSGVYSNIVNSVVNLMPTQGDGKQFLSEDAIRQAINKTLSPSFIQDSTETIINASYDWLQGKAQQITFTIPLAQQRPVLQEQLTAVIEPRVSNLPECSSQFSGLSSDDITCIPKGTTAQAMADDIARRSVESSDFLQKPLTQDDFRQAALPNLEPVRWFVMNSLSFAVGLPLFAILCAVLYVLLYDEKIVGLRAVARRVFFGTIFTVIIAGLLWGTHRSISLKTFGDQAIIVDVVDPLFHQVVGSVSLWLFIFSSIVLSVSGALWLTTTLIERQKKLQELPQSTEAIKTLHK